MRRAGLIIGCLMVVVSAFAVNDTLSIPLQMSTFQFAPMDGPTGSTPDPTDPNQFRASLVGNTLLIETQADQVSYVVIQESESERNNEDYFYGLSFGSIQCPITHAGLYSIHIGYWNTDFTGTLRVLRLSLFDFNGRLQSTRLDKTGKYEPGWYILRVETNAGTTTTKFRQL